MDPVAGWDTTVMDAIAEWDTVLADTGGADLVGFKGEGDEAYWTDRRICAFPTV